MPYVLVRESFINTFCCVEGLPLNEGKILGTLVLYLVYIHNDRLSISVFVLAYFMFCSMDKKALPFTSQITALFRKKFSHEIPKLLHFLDNMLLIAIRGKMWCVPRH